MAAVPETRRGNASARAPLIALRQKEISEMAKDLDEKVIPPARGKRTATVDFDRNRDGLYGGLPKARDRSAAGGKPNKPHPARDGKTRSRNATRTRV